MNRTKAILSTVFIAIIPLSVAVGVCAPRDAQAQYIAPPPPPDAYIASTEPEYFEGRPVYFYNGNWYYRDEHGWNYYHTEPPYLHERRSHWSDHDRRYHYHR